MDGVATAAHERRNGAQKPLKEEKRSGLGTEWNLIVMAK